MLVQTKYFGQVECGEEQELHFPRGLFGFEEEKSFLLLPFEGSGGSLLCFQSAVTPHLAFVAMNPFYLKPDYAPVLTGEELRELGVVRDKVSESSVNLRCPIALNDHTRTAMQVILETDAYQMHHPLSEFGKRKEGSPC